MSKKIQLPDIPEKEQTPLVKSLLVLLEQFAERIQLQDEEIASLKDEINILKGEKKWPQFKPSKMDQNSHSGSNDDDPKGSPPKKRAGSNKRSKKDQLKIYQTDRAR